MWSLTGFLEGLARVLHLFLRGGLPANLPRELQIRDDLRGVQLHLGLVLGLLVLLVRDDIAEAVLDDFAGVASRLELAARLRALLRQLLVLRVREDTRRPASHSSGESARARDAAW